MTASSNFYLFNNFKFVLYMTPKP